MSAIVDDDLGERRRLLARACRVMAHSGLVDNILGHISLRVGDDRLLVRCRGPEEAVARGHRDEGRRRD